MLISLLKKEFLQIFRDKKNLVPVIVAPILQLIVLGYAANLDVRHLPVVFCDMDKSVESRSYLDRFLQGDYFRKVAEIDSMEKIDRYIDNGEADAAIIVPFGFGKKIEKGEVCNVLVILNGTDPNVATLGMSYIVQISSSYRAGREAKVILKDRILYNPELKSKNFMVPGILCTVLMIITTMLTATSVVREKESGTIEQLAVTPVKRYQIILGKMIPAAILGIMDVVLVSLVAIYLFKVPFRGSYIFLLLSSLAFLLSTLGMGLFISTISDTQGQAMMTVSFVVVMPSIYLSGFIFPIDSMPKAFQYITYAIPLRYFLDIVRGIFLKGAGFDILWRDIILLLIIGSLKLTFSTLRFKKRW